MVTVVAVGVVVEVDKLVVVESSVEVAEEDGAAEDEADEDEGPTDVASEDEDVVEEEEEVSVVACGDVFVTASVAEVAADWSPLVLVPVLSVVAIVADTV